MLHAVYFHNSKVRYRNRWIVTKGLLYQMQAGQALPELRFSNCANTNIIAHAGTLLALYEIGLPYQITPELETVGEWNFQGATNRTMTAHPRLDPDTGELHFYRYSFFTQPYLTYYVADAKGNLLREVPLALPRPGLLHDMIISENYVIFFHCPLVFNFQQAMQCGSPFVWNPNYGTRIGLIHRHDLQQPPIWIDTEPFWVWHFMNAFETNGQITVDFAYYPNMSLDNRLASVLAHRSTFRRAVIDPNTKAVHYQPLDDRIVEFPTFDRRQTGKPYQFGYMSHLDLDWITQTGIPNYFSELIQYDITNQTSRVHRFPAGCYGGEAAVIPKPNGQAESDSYVMCWVYNEPQQTSDLVILDASRFDEAPIAQIHLPVRVPMGAHGNWIAQSALG
jgi:carotenoid cleavage dioxygenase